MNEDATKHLMSKTRLMVLTALFFANALIFSLIENMIPPLPMIVPGVKLGLANIVVMYALFFLGKGPAFTIVILKAGFVVMLNGPVAGFLSLFGGLLALGVMMLLIGIFKEKISYFLLSVSGAVFHNIGQFLAISLIYTNMNLWVYLPVLLIAGIIAGVVTATLLKVIFPAFKKLGLMIKD